MLQKERIWIVNRFQDLPVQCSARALWMQLLIRKKGTKRKRPMIVTKIDYRHSPVLPIPTTFKLIKNAVILIEWTQLTPEIFMHLLNKETRNVVTNCRKILKTLHCMSNSALLWRCSQTFLCVRNTRSSTVWEICSSNWEISKCNNLFHRPWI